jgi:hypothetical protein
MGLGKYKVVYYAEMPLCMWPVVGCDSWMRGVHSIYLELRTKDKLLCCMDQMTPVSELWDGNGPNDPVLKIVG